MKVRDQMTRDLVTVSEDTPLGEAQARMHATHLHCLPVVRDNRLVGLLLASNVRLSHAPPSTPVGALMTVTDVSITPMSRVEQAARLMLKHGVHGLPVVSAEGKLLGVLTITDLLEAIVERPLVDLWP